MSELFVVCPAKVTGPAPGYGLPPNAPCGAKVYLLDDRVPPSWGTGSQ
jgi:hypothetical protein